MVNCDRSAARPPCLMMLESEFLLRCYSDPYHRDFGNGFGFTTYGDLGGFGVGAHID